MRSFIFMSLCWGLASTLCAPAAIAHAAPASTAPAAINAKAQHFADLQIAVGNSDEAMDRTMQAIVGQIIKSSPDLAAIADILPDFEKKFIITLRPLMMEHRDAMLPGYRSDLTQFFSANFTDTELDALITFYQSPLAKKMLSSLSERMDYKNMGTEMARELDDENAEISAVAMRKDMMRAAIGAALQLTPDERKMLTRFSQTPPARKLNSLSAQRQAIELKWFNTPPGPELQKRMDAAITGLFEELLEDDSAGSKGKKRKTATDSGVAE